MMKFQVICVTIDDNRSRAWVGFVNGDDCINASSRGPIRSEFLILIPTPMTTVYAPSRTNMLARLQIKLPSELGVQVRTYFRLNHLGSHFNNTPLLFMLATCLPCHARGVFSYSIPIYFNMSKRSIEQYFRLPITYVTCSDRSESLKPPNRFGYVTTVFFI